MKPIHFICLFSVLLASCAHTSARRLSSTEPVSKTLRQLLAPLAAEDMYPADTAHAYFDWDRCFEPQNNRSPVRTDAKGVLLPECQPDTLYSWQEGGVEARLVQASTPANWNKALATPLFTHINPVATYGYGPTALRFKLKSSTQFQVLHVSSGKEPAYCKDVPANKSTVVVRVFEGGTDYILCSLASVASWSEYTPRHFDEVAVSALWFLDQSAAHDWLPYHESIPPIPGVTGPENLFISEEEQRDFDGHSFLQDDLTDRLVSFRAGLSQNLGRFFYAPGVANDSNAHFATNRPIYWNTRKAGLDVRPAPLPTPPPAPPVANGNYISNNPSFQVAYPTALFWPGDDSDPYGLTARGRDAEGRLSVSVQDATGSLAQAFQQAQQDAPFPVSYKTLNQPQGFFVLSGNAGGMISYQKVFVRQGKQISLELDYPTSQRSKYDPVVGKISQSFAPVR